MTGQELEMPPHKGYFHIVTGKNGSGKTRHLAQLSEQVLSEIESNLSRHSRVICLSGTVHDKYPRRIYSYDDPSNRCVYLGYKTNNNMFSEISPFRKLVPHILSANDSSGDAMLKASELMSSLQLGSTLELKFRRARNTKGETNSIDVPDLRIDLLDAKDSSQDRARLNAVAISGKAHLSELVVERNGQKFELSDLSSGERIYLLVVLGMCFCASPDSLILFDEPENSLHPSWQMKIVRDIQNITGSLHPGATVVIATHSPLIASSVRNSRVLACNLPDQTTWDKPSLHGKTSDSVLVEQFGINSPRSPSVSALIQKCLTHIALGETNTPDFVETAESLVSLEIGIDEDDPLYEAVTMIRELYLVQN